MVNHVAVEGFSDFASWLGSVVTKWPSKAAFAREVRAAPQLLEKWLAGSKPGDASLKAIATAASVDYRQLKMLTSGLSVASDPTPKKFSTRTEMGAIVGRKWEELREQNDSAAMNILSVIETLVTLQRDSYRSYSKQQQERSRKLKSEA
jgi:hypothetical protein